MKYLIGLENKNSEVYGDKHRKIRFKPDGKLPLRKRIKLYNVVIRLRSVFKDNGRFYP